MTAIDLIAIAIVAPLLGIVVGRVIVGIIDCRDRTNGKRMCSTHEFRISVLGHRARVGYNRGSVAILSRALARMAWASHRTATFHSDRLESIWRSRTRLELSLIRRPMAYTRMLVMIGIISASIARLALNSLFSSSVMNSTMTVCSIMPGLPLGIESRELA
jgi:hypothetical protein